MIICLDLYHDGAARSLAFMEDGEILTALVLFLPGRYDFGITKSRENITIVSGKLRINNGVYSTGQTCVIESGNPIFVLALEPSSYKCTYG